MVTAPLEDDATSAQLRQAREKTPMRPMPLVVLSHGIPFGPPFPGWPAEKMEAIMTDLQKDLATLVPNARYAVATKSGHNIHQDQPELVIAAIREVVEAVRDPSTWTSQAEAPIATSGDFAGLVDIGGRWLYLECHGTGGPTVDPRGRLRASARYWSEDLLHPDAPRTMVLPAVAQFTRVCAYDRPGTYAASARTILPSRSDPVPSPGPRGRSSPICTRCCRPPRFPAPTSWPATHGRPLRATLRQHLPRRSRRDGPRRRHAEIWLGTMLPPERWEALVRLKQELVRTGRPDAGYGGRETCHLAQQRGVREAATASPLRPMPLAVLAHGGPFACRKTRRGSPPKRWKGHAGSERDLATLVPNARFTVAGESGHDIHQDQPELVIEAIRQVVEGVRNPDTWYDLTSCCAT